MEATYFEIFKEIYFGHNPTSEAYLTDEERRKLLNERAAKAPLIFESRCGVDEANIYREMLENEERHRELVRAVMDNIMQTRKAQDSSFTFVPSRHDETKDAFSHFAMLLHFRYGIQHLVSQFTQPEIQRHLSLESHHPQYEFQDRFTEPILKADDILETAIDRISRNIQFNQGEFNREQFVKFLPEFRNFNDPGNPDVERLEHYMSYVTEANIALVKTYYDEIFSKPISLLC